MITKYAHRLIAGEYHSWIKVQQFGMIVETVKFLVLIFRDDGTR